MYDIYVIVHAWLVSSLNNAIMTVYIDNEIENSFLFQNLCVSL
jgi:hypothetical protein